MAVQTQIQWRRGTAASWTSTNPTLAAGEVGLETDTGKFKVGTGSSTWTALAYGTVLPATLTAKGSILAASAASTPAELAVGNNGETLVADSSTSTGLRWQGEYAAGKNAVINGDFGIWQRGTSFNPSATGFFLFADRWRSYTYAASATTATQQAFTPGTAPVAGYEGTYFGRVVSTNTFAYFSYNGIENVRTFAGQTVTLSYWAKSASAQTLNEIQVAQYFGSTGSAAVGTNLTPPSITTSWVRYTHTFTMPSVSGKTISGGNDGIFINIKGAINNALDMWGFQLEAGSVATPFQTASGSIGGELALCQRYYFRTTSAEIYEPYSTGGVADTANTTIHYIQHPVTMRVRPTSIDYANLGSYDGVAITGTPSAITLGTNQANSQISKVTFTKTASFTQYRPAFLIANNSTSAYIGLSAEL